MHKSLILLTVIAAAGLAWFMRASGPDDPAAQEQSLVANQALPQTDRVAAQAPAVALLRENADLRTVFLTDRLTAEDLDLSVRLVAADGSVRMLQPGVNLSRADLPLDAMLQYALPSGMEYSVAASACVRETAEAWNLQLPYSSAIALREARSASGEMQAGVEYLLCEDPRMLPTPTDPTETGEIFPQIQQDSSFDGLFYWTLKTKRIRVLAEGALTADQAPQFRVMANGPAALMLRFPDGSSGVCSVDLVPGEMATASVTARVRPQFRGQLLDWNDQPVPYAKVTLAVALDFRDFDIEPGDRQGMVGLKDDTGFHQTAKKSFTTDAEGRFQILAPRGSAYSLSSFARGGYGFWSTLDAGPIAPEGAELQLKLLQPGTGHDLEILVLQPDGNPLVGAEVMLAMPSDLPFFRNWPLGQTTDENGRISYCGLEDGMLVGIIVIHHGNGMSHMPPFFHVGPDRQICVQIPEVPL